jgi:hypothetical protein
MLDRVMSLTSIERATPDVSTFLCFSPAAYEDEVLASLSVVPQWRGLMMRNTSVRAWRDLWAWIVNGIDGLSPRAAVGLRLAEQFEADQTVRGFRDTLPATLTTDGFPAPAEQNEILRGWADACRLIGLLCIGAQRATELTGDDLHGFQGHNVEDIHEELAPTWLAERLDEWADRPVTDLVRWLANIMINRSQRLALSKARPDVRKGILKIPTRVHLRDDFIFRDSDESGRPASLRLDQLVAITAGMGLLTRDGDVWTRGPRGELLDDD